MKMCTKETATKHRFEGSWVYAMNFEACPSITGAQLRFLCYGLDVTIKRLYEDIETRIYSRDRTALAYLIAALGSLFGFKGIEIMDDEYIPYIEI